ncbi:hypothetical protein CDL15_Pgr011883 [Punica granatum]|uniref:Uncharacterized protein n=1 Tax=Punica granatum TaxID=22663 RepID=A0A218XFE1_PUNGR|nr:hypothetical protein CDL15_Pgr011883 [Punica granatum]
MLSGPLHHATLTVPTPHSLQLTPADPLDLSQCHLPKDPHIPQLNRVGSGASCPRHASSTSSRPPGASQESSATVSTATVAL